MAKASITPHGKRWRVRWRPGGGSQNPIPLSVDTEAEAIRAKKIIDAVEGDITKEGVIAALGGLTREEVEQIRAETAGELGLDGLEVAGTVAEVFPEYLRFIAHSVSQDQVRRYRQQFENRVLPLIGEMLVADVTEEDVWRVLNPLRECDCVDGKLGDICGQRRRNKSVAFEDHEPGLSKATIDRYYVAMKGFFSYTVRKRMRLVNPVKEIEYKPITMATYNNFESKDEKHYYMTDAEQRRLRDEFSEWYQLLLRFMAQTGVRYSEAVSLRVGALREGFVSIHSVKKRGDVRPFYFGLPKGGAVRQIWVQESLMEDLQEATRFRAMDDLLFQTPNGKFVDHSNFMRDVWNPAVARAMRCPAHPPEVQERRLSGANLKGPTCGDNGGMRTQARTPCDQPVEQGWNRCPWHRGIELLAVSTCAFAVCTNPAKPRRLRKRPTPHDLRHSHVARLIAAGVPMKAISDHVGHAAQMTTEAVYAGILPSVRDQIARVGAIDI